MLGTLDLKYDYTESGFCRVNYIARHGQNKFYYCLQLVSRGIYALYQCTKDGEPSHEININKIGSIELPPPETSTDEEVIEFLANL